MKKTPKTPSARDTLFSYLLGSDDIAGKKIVDLFAGGGGVSLGIELALGRSPDVAINHDEEAIAMHQHNHPNTRHYQSDIFEVDPKEAVGDAEVALLWLSPDCKHHSRAKGGRPLDQKIRSLAWVGQKWAGKVRPDVIVLENVPDFQHWGRLVAQRGVTEVQPDGKVKKIQAPWPNKPKRRGKQCRRFKRGMAKQQRPRGPIMTDADGHTLLVADKRPRYRGRTFRHFVRGLEQLGYVVEYRTLRADEYGVPTIRERFFLVARRDGKAISWPEPTHGQGRLPVKTAASCIDWSIPTRTIFEQHARRRKDLEPKTLTRVAMGVNKFVLGAQTPFLVQCNHGGHNSRQQPVTQPSITVTAAHGTGVVTPFLAPMTFDNRAEAVTGPLSTITTQGNRHLLVAPLLAPRYGERDGQAPRCGTVDAPLPTVTTGANGARLAVAHITKFVTGAVGNPADAPIGTICAGGQTERPGASSVFGVVAAHIVRHNGGGLKPEHAGYAADEPARTILAQGGPQALVSAALVQYNAANDAQSLAEPCRTVSTRDRYALMTAHLSTYYGDKSAEGDGRGQGLDAPAATVTTGNRHALTTVHVLRQFGTSDARPVDAPLGSLTSCVKDGVISTHLVAGLDEETWRGARRVYAFLAEFCPKALEKVLAEDRAQGLVTLVVGGEKYVIWDIGMRMLEPRELYRCQGFPDTYSIDFSIKGTPLSKASQVRMCGNSVPPPLVAAIVGAQFSEALREAAD
ncbi:hypothetical protein GO986_16340 [Deinococcus sp. HMF7620]|uniref:DNA (cytosine-5-)-methyltransferase n=1 Tax=Deinococcus arboris TaxID=2682977 RepID=A0A7C9LQ62_9DEIO|nr:DNA cytosine methyltransferase [Deinococcus arboris]MVN88316.1 hypothetical protein [Deinococcus arboris]